MSLISCLEDATPDIYKQIIFKETENLRCGKAIGLSTQRQQIQNEFLPYTFFIRIF